MKLRTKAKVNLFLRILGKRQDGYHELETIFHAVELADEIEISPAEGVDVEVSMKLAADAVGEPPQPADNCVTKAALALVAAGAVQRGVAIGISKKIPIAAGLGGGSGNAAGALLALNEHWDLGLDKQTLIGIASTLGSDTPYFIQGGTVLASGRGENLTHLSNGLRLNLVLGISNQPLRTSDVYSAWDQRRDFSGVSSAPMVLAIGAADVDEVGSLLHNDLEVPAFRLRPELVKKKEAMLEAGAVGALLSGSGPTIFGLAADDQAARQVAEGVAGVFDRVEVVRTAGSCVEMLDAALP